MSFLQKYSNIFVSTLSILCYFFFAYFLERTQFYTVSFLWFLLFAGFYILLKKNSISFASLVGVAVLFRLIFLFATPNLSQDFYRFIWDGRMILNGFNPYLSLPETFMRQNLQPIAEATTLYEGMGELNGSHYSNYPPLNQLCFFIAAIFASKSIFGSVIVLRILIILADFGILYFGKKLLERLGLPIKNIFWYVLNPFIIIEMTGNLHFEPIMLLFLVWAFYKLHQQKWIWAAVLFACSVSVKLIPLLFLPLFFQWFVGRNVISNKVAQVRKSTALTSIKTKWSSYSKGIKKLLLFYIIVLTINILLFLPFYSSEFLANYSSSVRLWFRDFEFNASFYYIFRKIGYLFRGYNEIAIIGKITPTLTILFLVFLSFFRNNKNGIQLLTAMLFGVCFYYFTATTVHPWYIATPLILSVFTKYRFPIIWSLVVIVTYQAYANTPWKENLWFVFIEYLVVFSFLTYEIFRHYKMNKL
jgi:alpha-1,6-mannosyltransferase